MAEDTARGQMIDELVDADTPFQVLMVEMKFQVAERNK